MNKIKDLYFFFVVLFSGLSLLFFRSQEGLIVLWAVGLLLFWKETIKPSKKLFIALSVWMGYFIINTLIIQSFHPMFMGTYIAKIMIAYWLLSYYKYKIFVKYENVIYGLASIALIFYIIQTIAPHAMYNILKILDLSEDLFPDRIYASIGIYTFHQINFSALFPRNAGFTWEPGPYSSYVVLALFINLARNDVKVKDKKRLLLFLLTLITTQSTTGMIAILAVVLWYSWSRFQNLAVRIISIPAAVALVIFLFVNIPWLQNKIRSESEQDLNIYLENSRKYDRTYAPGRFIGLQLGWEDFKNYPIAGYGGNTNLRFGFQDGSQVSAVNGFANIIGRYGSIGVLLFIFILFKSGLYLAKYFKYSGFFIFPSLIFIISFGFGIIEEPLIFTLLLAPIFIKKNEHEHEH